MKTVELASGRGVALVDDADYEKVAQYSWYFADGYARVTRYLGGGRKNGRRQTIGMHRLVMDAQPGQMIDHIDGDGLNNQRSNLRFCTMSQNQANSRRRRKFKSNYKGVYPHTGGWMVRFCRRYVGWYKTEEEAAAAYAKAAREKFGEFAYSELGAA
jgi:hypothetical protein